MDALTFDATLFRLQLPPFADDVAYPDALLSAQWGVGGIYLGGYGCGPTPLDTLGYMRNLMAAHLLALRSLQAAEAAGGGVSGILQSASIDKVAISLVPPTSRDAWGYWLNLTPYGQELAALLAVQSVGGMYIGGLPERKAFRKVAGVFF